MTTTPPDPEKKEYFIIARQIRTQEYGAYDYEFENVYIAIPERTVLLTYKEWMLLTNRLYRAGNEWIVIPVADPNALDVAGLIEEQRAYEAAETARKEKARKEREEAAAKANELRAARKALTDAAKREKKLKDLAKLKKELGVE